MPETQRGIRKAADWIKENPIYGVAVALTPLVALVAGLSGAVSSVNEVLGRPKCWTYSDVYYYVNGHFRNVGGKWVEFQLTGKFNFEEQTRNKDYILLLNKSERSGLIGWEALQVKLPVCDGTAQVTIGPGHWRPLVDVSRHVSSEIALEQQAYEQR